MDLTTRTARRRVPAGPRKRWQRIDRGRALGYRRSGEGAGTWHVRAFVGKAGGTLTGYRFGLLGPADDLPGTEGALSYAEAVDAARRWQQQGAPRGATVALAVARYLEWYGAHRRALGATRATFAAHVLPDFGAVKLEALTTDQLRRWHEALASAPARLRSPASGRPNVRAAASDEQRRSRRNTANRVLGAFKAALNRAWEDGLVPSREAWQRVKPFRDADAARVGYLDAAELRRLLNGCAPDFRSLVHAAVYTGARYGELAAAKVADFRPEASALFIPKSKAGGARFIYLGAEGFAFFDELVAGRSPSALLLTKAGGAPWSKSEQARPMARACRSAKLPAIVFHQLRHTYASLYLMSGGSVVALAKQLGHSTTRMAEKHYGHLAESWRADEAAKHAPAIGLDRPKVTRLGKKRRRGAS